MLSCKQVAILASEYLDKNASQSLNWKIRMHLMMCSNCRRFFKHLKITKKVTQQQDISLTDDQVDQILTKIKEQKTKGKNN